MLDSTRNFIIIYIIIFAILIASFIIPLFSYPQKLVAKEISFYLILFAFIPILFTGITLTLTNKKHSIIYFYSKEKQNLLKKYSVQIIIGIIITVIAGLILNKFFGI